VQLSLPASPTVPRATGCAPPHKASGNPPGGPAAPRASLASCCLLLTLPGAWNSPASIPEARRSHHHLRHSSSTTCSGLAPAMSGAEGAGGEACVVALCTVPNQETGGRAVSMRHVARCMQNCAVWCRGGMPGWLAGPCHVTGRGRANSVVWARCPVLAAADSLADALVSQRLVACVNIVPGLTSVYWWDGKARTGGGGSRQLPAGLSSPRERCPAGLRSGCIRCLLRLPASWRPRLPAAGCAQW